MTDQTPAAAAAATTRFYRWLVLVFISLAMFGNYYVYDCIGPLAPLLSKQGFTDSSIGLLQAIYSFPNIVMVLIGGIIIDRIGTKKSTMLFGVHLLRRGGGDGLAGDARARAARLGVNALLKVFGWVFDVSSVPPVVAVMAAGRLLFGLGAESLIVAVTTAIARWFKGKELSLAFGLNLTISRLGSLGAQVSPSWAGFAYASWQGPAGAVGLVRRLLRRRGGALLGARVVRLPTLRARRGRQDRQGGLLGHLGIRQVVLVHRPAVRHVLLGHLPVPDVRAEVLHRRARHQPRDGRRGWWACSPPSRCSARRRSARWWTGSAGGRR